MEAYFAVHFSIRKGLGPDFFSKTISVGLDDLDPEMTENDLRSLAISEAERELYNSEDYKWYGKNWTVTDIERI